MVQVPANILTYKRFPQIFYDIMMFSDVFKNKKHINVFIKKYIGASCAGYRHSLRAECLGLFFLAYFYNSINCKYIVKNDILGEGAGV
jgi:hypothetical protein